jgi:phosphoglycerate kinase
MKISLKTLSSQAVLRGRTVLVRVDWNVPVTGEMHREASLKIERSIALLKSLRKRGAKVVVLTHLGRPKKRDAKLSTKHLVRLLRESYSLDVIHQSESVSNKDQREKLKAKLAKAPAGSVHLLENVRFEKGEETNSRKPMPSSATCSSTTPLPPATAPTFPSPASPRFCPPMQVPPWSRRSRLCRGCWISPRVRSSR